MQNKIIDLHCDTLTKGGDAEISLDNPALEFSISKIPQNAAWAQCFAIFIPDTHRGSDAVGYFEYYLNAFRAQLSRCDRLSFCRSGEELESAVLQKKIAAILTVEGGCVLNGDSSRIPLLRECGVRILTLVWNGANELGCGVSGEGGLTPFGRKAIPLLEQNNILIDVSHLNDDGFRDVAELAEKPFLATHSNARSVCGHPRNLTDGQIREICRRGGLIGLNYHSAFLRDGGMPCSREDLFRHVEHFLGLGAEESLALGSDLDGALPPADLNSAEKVFALGDFLLGKGYSERLVRGILFDNAFTFFRKNLHK